MALDTTFVTYLCGYGAIFVSLGVSSFVASGFIRQTFSPFFLVLLVTLCSKCLVDKLMRGLYFFCRRLVLVHSGNNIQGVLTTPPDNGLNSPGFADSWSSSGLAFKMVCNYDDVVLSFIGRSSDSAKYRSDGPVDMMRSTISSFVLFVFN